MHSLDIKNLTVETGGKRVASGISLSIKGGEIHILMGPNGSGKSSLLNGLLGHPRYKVSGFISFDDKDITELPTEKRAALGIFLSMQHVPEISGVSMLSFIHRAYSGIIGKNISILEFSKTISERADKFGIPKEFLSRQVNSGFSGGEKKQAEILQLLALRPNFALLDEIDSGVDVDSLHKVFTAIEALKKEGVGFLLITHYPNILKKITPDFVHVMKDGKIVKSGGKDLAEEIAEKGFEGEENS
ncbi:MAG: Fe-S cluster assembly ATPase SufC [Patescibacteria group bacterium]